MYIHMFMYMYSITIALSPINIIVVMSKTGLRLYK